MRRRSITRTRPACYFVWTCLSLLLAFAWLTPSVRAQSNDPWDTQVGQACFEKWITETSAKLNALDGNIVGDADHNRRKPWGFDKFGHLVAQGITGYAPDEWETKYKSNRYILMWQEWQTYADGTWRYPTWNAARVSDIRWYVRRCIADAGGTNTGPGGDPPGGGTDPWNTPVGRACFEKWITETSAKLNALDGNVVGDADHNRRKPWGFDKFGHLVAQGITGYAPDGWETKYKSNRYLFMWEQWRTYADGTWRYPTWNAARIADIRWYVERCVANAGETTKTGPGGEPATGATNTTLPMPPFGYPEPYLSTPGMTIQAGQRQVAPGGLVEVPVYLIKGADVANINFDLTYDASVARPEGAIDKGNLLSAAMFAANPNESGRIRIGFSQSAGVWGSESLSYIRFRAVGKVGDKTDLTPTVTTINNPNGATPAIDRILGQIVIVDPKDRPKGKCPDKLEGEAPNGYDAFCALEMSTGKRPQDLILDMDASSTVTSRDATIILQRQLPTTE